MNAALHYPTGCTCPACKVAATAAGAEQIARWNQYAERMNARHDARNNRTRKMAILRHGKEGTANLPKAQVKPLYGQF